MAKDSQNLITVTEAKPNNGYIWPMNNTNPLSQQLNNLGLTFALKPNKIMALGIAALLCFAGCGGSQDFLLGNTQGAPGNSTGSLVSPVDNESINDPAKPPQQPPTDSGPPGPIQPPNNTARPNERNIYLINAASDNSVVGFTNEFRVEQAVISNNGQFVAFASNAFNYLREIEKNPRLPRPSFGYLSVVNLLTRIGEAVFL